MSLHERLRAETRASHDRAEQVFDLLARLSSISGYVDLLLRFHDLHARFEDGARSRLGGTPFAAALDGTERLAIDLRVLGEPAPPRPRPAVVFAGLPEALGAAYVFEGSRLGGLLIAREVQRRLGLGPNTGCHFFAGDGRSSAARWRAFCQALDAVSDPAHDDRIVASALRTFDGVAERLGPAALPAAA